MEKESKKTARGKIRRAISAIFTTTAKIREANERERKDGKKS